MDIRSVANAPRCVVLGGLPYFVGRLTPFGHGVILAYLEDVLGFADLGTEAAAEALLQDPVAKPLMLYAALYRHHPGFAVGDAVAMSGQVGPEQYALLINLLFARSAWGDAARKEGVSASGSAGREGWSRAIDRLSADRGLPYDAVIHMSYDQILNALYRGEAPAAEGPAEDAGEILSHDEVVRRWEARRAERLVAAEAPAPETAPPAESPAVLEAIRNLEAAKAVDEPAPGDDN